MWLPVSLLIVSLVAGQCQTIVEIDVSESRAFQYSISNTEIEDCRVTLPSGDTYELLPNDTLISLVDERYTVSSSDQTVTCGLSIDATTFSDSGSYLLNITDTDGVSYQANYVLRVQERTFIWPSSTIDLIATGSVYIFLPNIEETVQNCYVTPPGSEEVEVKYGATVSSTITQWSPSSNSWCGVEIMDVSSAGYWKLTAAVNSTHHYYNRTLLKPQDSSILTSTSTVVTSAVGQSLTNYIGHQNASYCQLTNPQGEIEQVVAGRCSFNLSMVTTQHNGTWIASTGLKGFATEITEEIDLDVAAISYIYAASSENEVISGAIDLYCRVDGVESEVCRFVSPDGTGVSMVIGVGNEKYAPYYDPDGLYTCGLTILELSSNDYGTWTCYTGTASDLRIGYISVTADETENDTTRSSSSSTTSISVSESYTAYSVYNESLTLTCSALTSLNYCWFKHPNGSYYAAVPDASDNGLWVYSGNGLSLGSCAITFTYSTYNDTGTWTCNMGITGQPTDLSVDITVKITSSALAATSIEESDGNAVVVCTVLNTTKALSYCRFIRPDGVGINALYADSDSRYSLTGTPARGTCGLAISEVEDVDIGTWVCAGRLESYSSEISDTFSLSSASKIGFSLLLLGTTTLKTFFS
ncbi:uncharacterized protein LOC124307544 [Neodiprion virginianus]|uniref:uncharacterized protein LOC124307544 n=1 Tax=Neodiprion virginianus TaxID=2961670 RepID=UPI001EE6AA82|nr:uncharacterized protein LOC124307544 [Neodiprion virginianus]